MEVAMGLASRMFAAPSRLAALGNDRGAGIRQPVYLVVLPQAWASAAAAAAALG